MFNNVNHLLSRFIMSFLINFALFHYLRGLVWTIIDGLFGRPLRQSHHAGQGFYPDVRRTTNLSNIN